MSRLKSAFENKKAFIGFVTAGDPSLEKTKEYILTMEKAGASLVEIGIPFSDPIAEGKVIEEADKRALDNGTTIDKIFDMVTSLRLETDIPLVFLTYINPVFKYGYERFAKTCSEAGVDGIIIPDLPYEEKEEIHVYLEKYGIDMVPLVAPTSAQRIEKIASEAEGFIYCVSSLGVTGIREEFNDSLQKRIQEIRKYSGLPVAVGFGISTPKQTAEISSYADGVIVGSAIVKLIAQYGDDAANQLFSYVKAMCDEMNK